MVPVVLSTVAILLLLLLQMMVVLALLPDFTAVLTRAPSCVRSLALAVTVSPAVIVPISSISSLYFDSTVILLVPVTPLPSCAAQVIVAVPVLTAVMVPSLFTDTIPALLLLHMTALLSAVRGVILAVNFFSSPLCKVSFAFLTSIFFTCCFTVTVQVAVMPEPSAAVQVMVAVPCFFARTAPLLDTTAICLLLLEKLTFRLVATIGSTFLFICFVSLTYKVNAVVLN